MSTAMQLLRCAHMQRSYAPDGIVLFLLMLPCSSGLREGGQLGNRAVPLFGLHVG